MGDTFSYFADQEAEAEHRRQIAKAKERHKNVDPVALNRTIEALLSILKTQQLTEKTFSVAKALRKTWFGEEK